MQYVWFRISQKRFKQLVDRLLQFISLRLFPAKPEEFPPMVKCTWWIPSATKVLALFSRYFSWTVWCTFLCVYVHMRGETDDGGTVWTTTKCQKVGSNKTHLLLARLRTCFLVEDNCYTSFSCNNNWRSIKTKIHRSNQWLRFPLDSLIE